jgi:hypothetical protein
MSGYQQSQYGNQTQYGNQAGPVTQYGTTMAQTQYGNISSIPQQFGTVSGIQSQQYGTVSQGQFVGAGGAKGESIPGSQKVVSNASHWWLQHTEEEPLPNCVVPVTSAPSPWPCESVLRV